MFRPPSFCKACNNANELKMGKYKQRDTFCGHIQQASTLEGAINLANHGGERPCSFSPIRKDFLKLYRPEKKRIKLYEVKSW